MIAQLRIYDRGELEPVTWDGEPLYSPETVRAMTAEQLFDAAAFEQMRGQMALEQAMGEAWDGPRGFWENRERNL